MFTSVLIKDLCKLPDILESLDNHIILQVDCYELYRIPARSSYKLGRVFKCIVVSLGALSIRANLATKKSRSQVIKGQHANMLVQVEREGKVSGSWE